MARMLTNPYDIIRTPDITQGIVIKTKPDITAFATSRSTIHREKRLPIAIVMVTPVVTIDTTNIIETIITTSRSIGIQDHRTITAVVRA